MDRLPHLVQNKIFLNLSRMPSANGWFYPPSVYRPAEIDQNRILANQLRFCLIYPKFLEKLEFDLDSLPFECLFLTSQFEHLNEKSEEILKKRIRLDPDIYRHNVDCYGRWIIYSTTINDFIQPREAFADWIFRKAEQNNLSQNCGPRG